MVNDPITKIMRNASEIVRYDEVGIPLSIREGLLSAYPNHRALCHWHEDIEWVYIRSGQMNYYMNGKRVLLNTGEALMVNSRQMHYGYSENGQDCDFIRILCHPKIFITNSVLYQSYIAPVLSNPSLEYLHLKPEFPEDAEALQLLPEILRIKKEHPAAYEIEAAALLSLLWCRLLRSHPMMPNEAAAKPKEPAQGLLDHIRVCGKCQSSGLLHLRYPFSVRFVCRSRHRFIDNIILVSACIEQYRCCCAFILSCFISACCRQHQKIKKKLHKK